MPAYARFITDHLMLHHSSIVGGFQLCSLCFLWELYAVALAIAVPEQFFLPGRLRLAIAILSAALGPFWAALGVLQVTFLGSERRGWTAPFPLPCAQEPPSNDTKRATENDLNEHFFRY